MLRGRIVRYAVVSSCSCEVVQLACRNFEELGDEFGRATARLLLGRAFLQLGELERAKREVTHAASAHVRATSTLW